MVEADSNKLFTVVISGTGSGEKIKFGFDDTKETFIRKRFNTNPQLTSTGGTLYPAGARKVYWLGETFDTATSKWRRFVRWCDLTQSPGPFSDW